MKKQLLFFFLIFAWCAPLPAQVTGEVERLVAQWITQTEREETVLEKGEIVFDETDPSKLYIGDGQTSGGVQVSSQTASWDHVATQDILMQGNRLQLGDGFSLLQLGGYYALSGNGELSVQPGEARISANSVPLLKLKAGELLTQVYSLTWDPGEEQFALVVVVGTNPAEPIIQTNNDLVDGTWVDITPASIGAVVDGQRTILIDYEAEWDVIFFRAILPSQAAEIELLADTTVDGDLAITGDLTVTGSIPRSADIDLGVTAHGWGDHGAEGYLTVVLGGVAPASSDAAGTPGTFIQSGNYLYICIATNTWRRVQLLDWE